MPRYSSFPFGSFKGGLNLRDKADAVSPEQCIDALNVVFSDLGAVEQRHGYAKLTGTALTNRVDSLSPFYTSSGTKQLVAGCGTRLEGLSSSGTVVASATGLTGGPYGFARFGSPNEEVLFAGNGTDTLRKWNGTVWSAPTATVDGATGKAMPKARYLAAWPFGGNRLVCTGFSTTTGGPNGGTSSPSHVYLSEPGNPEAYESTAFVQLDPGDGEATQGVIGWKEFVFVFKESQFFVFKGESTDEAGKPEFNWYPVTGVGLVSPRALCAHHTGVYFLGRNGVYRTTGQEPELISQLVDPIFTGEASSFYLGGTLAQGHITNCAMTAKGERIYLSFPTEEANNRTLVYDTRYKWWTLYDLPCAALCSFRPGNEEELVFGYASGENLVGRHSKSYTNDAEAAIVSRWRSGWGDLGTPEDKKVRATKVWGTGKVQMAIGTDFEKGHGKEALLDMEDASVTNWGESTWGGGTWAEPVGLIGVERRRAERGMVFSVYFSNETLNQEWSVHRIEHLVPSKRDPAVIQK